LKPDLATLPMVCPHCRETTYVAVAKLLANKGEATCSRCGKTTKATPEFLAVLRAMK
jgi:predicted Zn finger-like uncharacterized protein